MQLRFTLRQLEYFDAVAAEGSLTAAAERCRVTTSALALGLDDLERHLGVQLLVRRKGRGVTLTTAGSLLLSMSRQLLAGAESLAAEAQQASQSVGGRIALGVFETLSPIWLPAILQAFRQEHSEIEVDFVEGTVNSLHDQLLQGRIDVALMYQVDVSAQLHFEAIHAHAPHIIVAEGHPLAGRGRVQLDELAGEPFISLEVAPARHNTQRLFQSLGLQPRIAYRVNHFELARCLVGRGLGYAVLFQRPATAETYDGQRVVRLDLLDPVEPTVVGLASPLGAPSTARRRALEGFLKGMEIER